MSGQGGGMVKYGCYIGNIDRSVTLDMLKQMFCQCGTILDASLNGRSEDPYRFGFIDFATEDDRARALKYNGFTLVGRKLRVNVSKGGGGKSEGDRGDRGDRGGRGGDGERSHSGGASPYPSAMQSAPAAASGGLNAAQQAEAQLLLQLIQQGSVDPTTLNDAQRTLLVAALSGGSVNANSAAEPAPAPVAQPQAAPMQAPMVPPMMAMGPMGGAQGMYPPMWGAYGMNPYANAMNPYGAPMMGGNGGYRQNRPPRGPANPPPPEETLKLRELQRRQFLKVLADEAEAYEKKQKERSAKADDGISASSGDSGDDEGEETKRARTEGAEEAAE